MLEDADFDLLTECLGDRAPLPAAVSLRNAPSTVWIASGLAKISALYGLSMLQRIAGVPCRFVTPLEYGQNNRIRCLPVLTSLRGNHRDAVEVAEAIAARGGEDSILVTGDPLGDTSKLLMQSCSRSTMATDELPERDTRFVNLKSILMLSALTHRMVQQSLDHPDECDLSTSELKEAWIRSRQAASDIANQIQAVDGWQEKQLFILSDGMTSELALTWQSIISESGVLSPVCLDIKDYTHGDHLAATRTGNCMYLVISHEGTREVCETFTARFSTLYPVMSLALESCAKHRFWENLFAAANTTALMTRVVGYPNQRPPKHPVVWSWRGWGSIHPSLRVS